jgi:hypothetical protein
MAEQARAIAEKCRNARKRRDVRKVGDRDEGRHIIQIPMSRLMSAANQLFLISELAVALGLGRVVGELLKQLCHLHGVVPDQPALLAH